jgi:hypothetical protein
MGNFWIILVCMRDVFRCKSLVFIRMVKVWSLILCFAIFGHRIDCVCGVFSVGGGFGWLSRLCVCVCLGGVGDLEFVLAVCSGGVSTVPSNVYECWFLDDFEMFYLE